ncbi:MAG: hypothetical protein ACYDH6_00300 [Acidimicrobiales bacterium]
MIQHASTDLPAESAAAQLAARAARLRTRAGPIPFDRWLMIAAGVVLPLGLLVIVLGWFNAAHTVLVFEQIPYLLSGGVFGLALVFTGGFIYFGYWLTLLIRESRGNTDELLAGLGRIEDLLAAAVARLPGAAEDEPPRPVPVTRRRARTR